MICCWAHWLTQNVCLMMHSYHRVVWMGSQCPEICSGANPRTGLSGSDPGVSPGKSFSSSGKVCCSEKSSIFPQKAHISLDSSLYETNRKDGCHLCGGPIFSVHFRPLQQTMLLEWDRRVQYLDCWMSLHPSTLWTGLWTDRMERCSGPPSSPRDSVSSGEVVTHQHSGALSNLSCSVRGESHPAMGKASCTGPVSS